jgi:hypothetical protein
MTRKSPAFAPGFFHVLATLLGSHRRLSAGCPLWVTSRLKRMFAAGPLFPRKHTSTVNSLMSASGQKRTSNAWFEMKEPPTEAVLLLLLQLRAGLAIQPVLVIGHTFESRNRILPCKSLRLCTVLHSSKGFGAFAIFVRLRHFFVHSSTVHHPTKRVECHLRTFKSSHFQIQVRPLTVKAASTWRPVPIGRRRMFL